MPSFDVVSEIDRHELSNALDQVNRELTTRFDFKDSGATIREEKEALLMEAQSDFQLKQMLDILYQKMAKRGLDVGVVDPGEVEVTLNKARQRLALKEGVGKELAKEVVKAIKESKIKVQAAIQGEQVRITGKKRDDLQEAIALLRSKELGQPLQYNNFRD